MRIRGVLICGKSGCTFAVSVFKMFVMSAMLAARFSTSIGEGAATAGMAKAIAPTKKAATRENSILWRMQGCWSGGECGGLACEELTGQAMELDCCQNQN